MGGGNFVVPVQRVTDFLENKLSGRFFFTSDYCHFILDLHLIGSSCLVRYISATIKLSARSEGIKSPWTVSCSNYRCIEVLDLHVWQRGLTFFFHFIFLIYWLNYIYSKHLSSSSHKRSSSLELRNISVTGIYFWCCPSSWCRGTKLVWIFFSFSNSVRMQN